MKITRLKSKVTLYLLLGIALASVSIAGSGTRAQEGPGSQQQFEHLIRSTEGPDLFRAYCATCHGLDAKGHGPAAAAMKTKVPDLTLLTRNNGGQFPSVGVRNAITGDVPLASHGSRDMPIWGPIFHQIEEDVDRGNVRLDNLVNYLRSIQSVPPRQEDRDRKLPTKAVPSGAELYRQHCAACHSDDLRGNGPAPAPFKERPPDLTTLARRHGGKFPDDYVSEVLRNGIVMPAHGPPEMPTWGTDFKTSERLNETQVTLRITSVKDYIKSLQAK